METDEWIVIGAMIFVALVGVFLIQIFLKTRNPVFKNQDNIGKLYLILLVLFLILGALGVIFYGLYENKRSTWWIVPTGVIGFLIVFLVFYLANKRRTVRKKLKDSDGATSAVPVFDTEYENQTEYFFGKGEDTQEAEKQKLGITLLHQKGNFERVLGILRENPSATLDQVILDWEKMPEGSTVEDLATIKQRTADGYREGYRPYYEGAKMTINRDLAFEEVTFTPETEKLRELQEAGYPFDMETYRE